MSLLGLLNQTITIYPKSSYNSQGREVSISPGVPALARIQPKQKTKLKPNGEVQIIDAVANLRPDADIDIDYKVTYAGVSYKVVSKYPVPGRHGDTHHIEAELSLWQAT